MKKSMLALSLIVLGLSAFAGEKIAEYTLPNVKAELVESTAWPGKYMINAEGLLQPSEPLGAPMLPYKTLSFAVPNGYSFKEVKVEADWEVLSEKIKILPIQKPVPVSENPERPEYVESTVEATYPEAIAQARPMKITGLDVIAVSVTPFKYCEKTGLLEKAKNLKLSVIFTEKPRLMSSFSASPSSSTPLVHPDYIAATLSTLVNPEDAAPKAEQLMAAAAGTQVDYLMISPPDLYETWEWYIGKRKENHPTLNFDIVNTYDIYNTYPFKGWVKDGVETTDGTYANAAESIHAFLTAYSSEHALKYVVLGGAWLDVNDKDVAGKLNRHYLQDGTEITYANAVPGVVIRVQYHPPSDLFYACVERYKDNPGHPWDLDGDELYVEPDELQHVNLQAKFAVSRMTMKPYTYRGETFNQHQVISNFVKKVNRAEDPKFVGNFKMGLASSPLNFTQRNLTDKQIVLREEEEFFDNVPNMYDPAHSWYFSDVGPVTRRHAKEIVAPYHPIIDAIGFHEPDSVSHNSTKQWVFNDFYRHDRETGSNNGHGSGVSAALFSANKFITEPGLTKINVVGISCNTGHPDLFSTKNGKSVADVSLGEAGLANITETGGFIASMNNTRVGLSYFETVRLDGAGISERMHYNMCINVAKGMTVGEAWLGAVTKYLEDSRPKNNPDNINPAQGGTYCMAEEMLYGDPLIKIVDIYDYTWNGGNSGTWDMTTQNWTKDGEATEFYHADNINFNVSGDTSITLNPNPIPQELNRTTLPYGGMRMNITQGNDDTFSLGGTGWLRLMNNINVSGGTLEIGVSGGVGGVDKTENERGEVSVTSTGGIIFENTGKLVLNNNNSGSKYYFINGVKNASEIAFKGGGAILELGGLDNTLQALTFEGQNSTISAGNVLRTNRNKTKGELVRFLPLSLKNIALTLETYEAFDGYTGETIATLEGATLSFRQNRWRGATDNKGKNYAERISKKLVMTDSTLAVDATEDFYLDNATLEMSGNCRFVTMNEGKFNLIGTTTVHLADGAVCRLDADFNAGKDGKLVFTGSGRVIVGLSDGPAGAIRVEGGATLEMELFMFTRLSRLELATGTTIVLPYQEDNFFQVIPITGEMVVEGELVIKVKDENDAEAEIIAEHTATGSIFQFGSLLEWASADGEWTLDTSIKPWRKNDVESAFDLAEHVYFPDIEGGEATVRLAMALEKPFVCFGNKTTHYTFTRANDAPETTTLIFDSLVIGGWTHFTFPLTFEKQLGVSGGDFEVSEVVAPVVEIADGGVFEATTLKGKSENLSEVTVNEDGRFTLQGSHKMNLVLKKGAYLKAENDKHLDWNSTTSIVWPADGSKVKIDVSDFTPSETSQVIISGEGYNWTMQDLRKLEVAGNTCSLAVVDGALCLVQSDGIASPYTMTVDSAMLNWDNATWKGGDVAFPNKWSESYLDWTADGVITVAQDGAVLTLDKPARFNTLKFVPVDESVKDFTFTIAEGGELKVNELHFEGFEGAVTVNNLEIEEGELYPSTEMHLNGSSGGVLRSGGNDTIYIYEPSEKWILGEGAQGFLHLAITDNVKAVRQKVLVIDEESEWPIGGFEVSLFQPVTVDRAEDFFISREGPYVYIVPPEVHASAPAGVNNWTELTWYAYDGTAVTIEDWNDVYAARIEAAVDGAEVIVDGCPTAQLTIGPASGSSNNALILNATSDAAIKLPKGITMNAPATVNGDLVPTFDYVRGAGKLTLDTGATTTLTLSANVSPIEDGCVELKAGSKIVLHHTIYYSTTNADWSGLTGDGEVEISRDGNFRFTIPVPSKMFASTLSLNLQSELAYQLNAGNYTMNVSNLSGAGVVGYGVSVNDFIAMLLEKVSVAQTYSGTRTLRTTQTRVSEWKGVFSSWVGLTDFKWVLDTKFVVAGSESAPSINRRLIYSGTSNTSSGENFGNNHELDIESSGCLELNGFWNGTINNNGLLIFGRNARVNNDSSLAGSGYITTDGDVIDLVARPALATKYKLYSGTEGTIKFKVDSFATKTTVIPVQSGFTLGAKPLMMLAVDANGDMRWKEVALDDIENGNLVWNTEGEEIAPLTINLAAGENDFDTLVGSFHSSGVSELIFNGAASGDSSVAIGDQLRTYTGALTLKGGATITGLSPLMGSLTTNPSGKLVFTLQDITTTQDLVKVPNDFVYDADNFSIEVVGPNGETNPMGTWTKSGEKLIYKIVDINAVTTGFKFDGNATSWGSKNTINAGNFGPENYVSTRDGSGITSQNPYGGNLYLGPNDWTFVWCARLSPTVNGAHFALGTKSNGGLTLTTVDANHAALSRWKGNTAAERLFTVQVPSATSRFYSYAVTYRAGLYTFYANGEKVGSRSELEGATALSGSVNWQFFTIHGGNVNNIASGSSGVIDDVRAYDVALTDAAIQQLAEEFPAWPDLVETKENEVIERDVNDFSVDGQIGNVCLVGDGTLRLVGVGEARLCQIDNQSRLVIADGVTVRVTINNGNPNPLNGHEVVVEHGGRLVFEHADNVTSLANCNLSNIMGEGTVEFLATVADRYIYPATTPFAATLSFCNNTTIYLGPYWNNSSRPFKVTNLSGSGTFRYDTPKTSGRRYMEVTQTESTVFTGVITDGPDNVGGGYTVTVKSDGETATDKKALTLSLLTDASGLDKVIVDSTGCLMVKKNASLGAAEITNNGLLVFSPQPNEDIRLNAFTFNDDSTIHSTIALSGNGTLYIPLNSKHFLASSPVGVIDVLGSEGKTGVLSLIRVENNFKFLKNVFRVSGALEGKELAVSGGWLCAAANAVPGGTAWSTESGEWTASGFNNGTGTTSGSAVSFEDAVSTQSGRLVDAVAITVNETVSALQMNFNSTLTSYTFTGSGSIDSDKFSFIDGGAPVVLGGVTLTQSSIELVVPTSVAVGTRLIAWSTPYENTFTSASLNAAGLTLEKRDDGLYVVEQPVDLDTMFYQFSTENTTYDATKLATSPSSMTIACSLKTASPNETLWTENLVWGATKVKVGLMTGDTADKIKFFVSVVGSATSYYPSEGVTVPFANKQTHTYIITFDSLSGSYGKWTLYVDGVKAGESGEKELAFLYNNTACNYTHEQTTNANGYLQDGRIYSRVLNTSEIKAYTELFPKTPVIHLAPRIIVR